VARFARLLEIVNGAQRAQLFSSRGLSMSELTPRQRELAATRGRGLADAAVFDEWVLQNQQGGDKRLFLKWIDGGLQVRTECLARAPFVANYDLRLPEASPEVCRVSLLPDEPE
jgi:hypothetical protein